MTTGRILIVDDSDNIRNVLQMNFEWLGYQVLCARDGEEALRRVEENPPDLIILDVMMPRRNGYQVCRTLKSDPRLREIPVIFLTAKDQKEDRFWGKDCGADEYLTKPFSAAKLEQVIDRLLRGRRSEDDRAGDITERVRALSASGVAHSVAWFRADGKALQVFRQKYGEIRYQEAMEGLRSTIEVVLGAGSADPFVRREGDGQFRAVVPLSVPECRSLAGRVASQANLYLKSIYSREDAERGYIVSRTNPEGTEVHVPLLAVESEVAGELQQA